MLRDSRQRTGRIGSGLAAAALVVIVVVGVLAAGLRARNASAQTPPPNVREKPADGPASDLETSRDNLKHLGLALYNYHDVYGHFPPAVVTSESGQKYSWRVALLPYLGQKDLYSQYHFDEPWDSDANRSVRDHMPDVYRAPQDDKHSSNTSYFVFTGDGTAFSGDMGISVEDIKDDTITFQPGDRPTANTILVVEFKMDVPWTKPEDIDYPADPFNPPHLSSWYDDRFLALMADGSTRGFPLRLDRDVSRALIEISDGSVIDWSKIPNLTK